MSNFKIYDPTSNTSIDVADMFVRRSAIPSLLKPVDTGSELWIFGKSITTGTADAPRRLSTAGSWALSQGGMSESYDYGVLDGVDLIPRNDGALFAHGLAGLSTVGPSLTDTTYQNGALYVEPTVVGPTPPTGIANYNNSFIFGAASTRQAAYYLVRDYSTGDPVVKMYSGGNSRWLGIGYSPNDFAAPYRTPTLTASPSSSNWKSIATMSYSTWTNTASILEDGTLWTWGPNDNGQLGRGTGGDEVGSVPGQITGGGTTWRDIAVGGYHMASIKSDSTLWTWGWGVFGALGNNSTTDRSSPVQTISAGSVWRQVACGFGHTAAIKTDGTLWSWGFNNNGQLGDNTTTNKSSPVQTVSGGTNWKQVACGSVFTAAVKSDGTLWTWGINGNGQLGTGATGTSISSPIQVGGAYGAMWSQVQARANGFYAVNYPEVITPTIATGGDIITTFGGYKYHVFTTSGTLAFTQLATGGTNVEAIIVGGGGGGGAKRGGGGGAGGFTYVTVGATASSYSVTIGAGGAGAPGQTSMGSDGSLSRLFMTGATVAGGGGGSGGWSGTAGSGGVPNGSGGGGGEVGPGGGGGTQPGAGNGTGNAGGAKVSLGGSGGGGAATAGSAGPSGAGGLGNSSFSAWGTITGTTTVYSTGGRGGDSGAGTSGPAGTPNTGNGGEGADDNSGFVGGAGGSGIIVVRYPFAG